MAVSLAMSVNNVPPIHHEHHGCERLKLGCEEFVLVNLLRKRHENAYREDPRRDFAERACVLTPESRFVLAHWEDLIAAAPSICDQSDSGSLVSWARNKSELLRKPAFDF